MFYDLQIALKGSYSVGGSKLGQYLETSNQFFSAHPGLFQVKS